VSGVAHDRRHSSQSWGFALPSNRTTSGLTVRFSQEPKFLDRNLELALDLDAPPDGVNPFASLVSHVRVLLDELRPGGPNEILAEMIVAALGTAVVAQLRRERGFDLTELQPAAGTLLRGVLGAETARSYSSTEE
jgi:hypothetical protein